MRMPCSCQILLWLSMSGLTLWAKPPTPDQPNPFAPLESPQAPAVRMDPLLAQAKVPIDPLDANVPPLSGIVWSRAAAFALFNDTIVTLNSPIGSGKVAQITQTRVVIADANDSRVLSMPGLPESGGHPEISAQTASLYVVHTHDALVIRVLECLAIQARTNIVFPTGIQTRVSLRLWDVDWDTAFRTVLGAGGCTATQEGRTWVVRDSQTAFVTETFNLNYAHAKTLEDTLTRLLSSEGKMGIDSRRNAVVVTDRASQLERVREAVRQIDAQAPQVLIDVLIVNVKLTHALKMGVDWSAVTQLDNGATLSLEQGLSATGGLPPFGRVQLSKTTSNWDFQGLMDFIESHEDVKVLANPKVLVMNNQTATIDSVEEIPYQELSQTSGGGSIGTTAFKEAGVKLEVTPQISSDGTIILHIKPEQSARVGTFRIQGSDTPVIETRKAETTLRVMDGQTIIIGGLRKRQPSRSTSRVPVLGSIPLVGRLFQQVNNEDVESELGVFITPRIWTAGIPEAEQALLDRHGRDTKPVSSAGSPASADQSLGSGR